MTLPRLTNSHALFAGIRRRRLRVIAKGAQWTAVALLANACARHGGASGSAAEPRGEPGKASVLVGPDAYEGGELVLAAWVSYGAAKANAYFDHPPPSANESADDFATELAGREAQAQFWAEQKKNGAPAHPLFDKEVEIWRAGLLPEFVISIHGHPGWTVPAAVLPRLKFEAFLEKFAGQYDQGAPVVVQSPAGKAVPDVPGADFPDPASLRLGAASCQRALDERKAAWNRLADLEKRLGGVPVSATTTIDFARQLIAARNETAHRTRGVTWVSPRVGHLAALEGFCAVEKKDWPEALRALSPAIALRPSEAVLRLELALALTATNRADDALDQVTRALAITTDGCVVGLAWRRRGYILVEKGALEAAQAAYETSLKYDPKNRIARDELATIAQMRRDRRAHTPEPTAASVPPFGMTVTECKGGSAE